MPILTHPCTVPRSATSRSHSIKGLGDNFFLLDESQLKFPTQQSFNLNAASSSVLKEHVSELEFELEVLGKRGQYIAPAAQCTIFPNTDPLKGSILTAGVQANIMSDLEDTRQRQAEAARVQKMHFIGKEGLFLNWKRAGAVVGGIKLEGTNIVVPQMFHRKSAKVKSPNADSGFGFSDGTQTHSWNPEDADCTTKRPSREETLAAVEGSPLYTASSPQFDGTYTPNTLASTAAPDTDSNSNVDDVVTTEQYAFHEVLKIMNAAVDHNNPQLKQVTTPFAAAHQLHKAHRSPHVVVTRPACLPNNTAFQPFLPEFVKGKLNDDVFLVAVAAVATDLPLLMALFQSTEYLPKGAVTLRFFKEVATGASSGNRDLFATSGSLLSRKQPPVFRIAKTEAAYVTIDTLIPVTNAMSGSIAPTDLELVFGSTSFGDEAWLVLLEKAYAAFCGSYAALDRGDTIRTLVHLTGGIPRIARWDSCELSSAQKENLWWLLQETVKHGDVAVLNRKRGSPFLAVNGILDEGEIRPTFLTDAEDLSLLHVHTGETETPITTDWSDALVVLFACEYDSTVEIPQDYYAKLRGQPTRRGETYRLVKVRRIIRVDRDANDANASQWSWGNGSPKWTPQAREYLSRRDSAEIDDQLTFWMTLDELVARYCLLASVTNASDVMATSALNLLAPCDSIAELPLYVPHFSVSVKRPTAQVDQTKALNSASNFTQDSTQVHFQSIRDVVVPPLDFGDESEDEDINDSAASNGPQDGDDNNSEMCASTTSSPKSQSRSPRNMTPGASVIFDMSRIRNSLLVEFRFAVPPSEAKKKFCALLYCVPRAGAKVELVKTLVDGVVTYSLPVHGRVPHRIIEVTGTVKTHPPSSSVGFDDGGINLYAQPENHDASAQSNGAYYFFEAELNEGDYDVLVYADIVNNTVTDVLNTEGPVLLTATKRSDPQNRFSLNMQSL